MPVNGSGMSLSNYSQVLLRNSDLLEAESPLLVNLTADNLISEYIDLYPQASISTFTNNFEQYQEVTKRYYPKVKAGFAAHYQTDIKHDLVILAFPKSKAELAFTLAMLSGCLTQDAQILIVGEKNGGIKSSPKLIKDYLSGYRKIDAARHCMLFCGTFVQGLPPFNLDDWYKYYSIEIQGINLEIAALPGVFSQEGLDKGTDILLHHLPETMTGKVLDFGCGAGVIAGLIGKKYSDIDLTLVDVSALALKSAEKTLAINKLAGSYLASNSLSEVTGRYQHIVSNPPFHQGIKTHYRATESFLEGIRTHMQPGASIHIVANSFLRYRPIMEKAIGKTEIICQEKGFTVYQCRRNK